MENYGALVSGDVVSGVWCGDGELESGGWCSDGVRVGSWCRDSIYPIPVVCNRWGQHPLDTG